MGSRPTVDQFGAVSEVKMVWSWTQRTRRLSRNPVEVKIMIRVFLKDNKVQALLTLGAISVHDL